MVNQIIFYPLRESTLVFYQGYNRNHNHHQGILYHWIFPYLLYIYQMLCYHTPIIQIPYTISIHSFAFCRWVIPVILFVWAAWCTLCGIAITWLLFIWCHSHLISVSSYGFGIKILNSKPRVFAEQTLYFCLFYVLFSCLFISPHSIYS